jgi:UDP-N-acetylglucosamine 2-epimerase
MKILTILGTRPEAIKMMPVIKEMQKYLQIEYKICITGQHQEMLYQVLDLFNIKPDYDLHVMQPQQTLFDLTANILSGIEKVIEEVKPDLI